MQIKITFPYQFYLTTKISSLNMELVEQSLTYRKILEILGSSFDSQVRKMILASDNEIMVVIILDHQRVDPDDQVRDGAVNHPNDAPRGGLINRVIMVLTKS